MRIRPPSDLDLIQRSAPGSSERGRSSVSLSMLLDGAVETLDISPDLYDTAVRRYMDVGTWLGLLTAARSWSFS